MSNATSTQGARFAPLIRVSTEQQEKQGESLRTQKRQIVDAVKSLGGVIPDYCWAYSGQEHATPEYERRKLDQLLEDAEKDLFEAVIVVDASRWSRDNEKSKQGLRVLRDSGVRFFTGTIEQDLYDPNHTLFLGMAAEIGEYQARLQALKSMQSRIDRAKRGLPVSGKLPWGRLYDKETQTWSLDEEKAKSIRYAAQRYLAGESMENIAETVGMKLWTLWNVLRKRAGGTWQQRFRSKKLNIDETVETPIPPLLDEATIQAIAERAEANKTYTHGKLKHFYLLSRMVFCAECGYAMFGQTNHGNRRYYRHAHNRRVRPCESKIWVRAGELEDAVMAHLFHMLGDARAIEKAIERAIPNLDELERLHDDKASLETTLKKVATNKERLIDAVAEGVLVGKDIKTKKDALDEQEAKARAEIARIDEQLKANPLLNKEREKVAARTKALIAKSRYKSFKHFTQMSDEAKRELVELVFSGKDANGNRLGVYVSKDEAGALQYEIRGHLPEDIEGRLPMPQGERDHLLGVQTVDSEAGPEDCVTKCDDPSPDTAPR